MTNTDLEMPSHISRVVRHTKVFNTEVNVTAEELELGRQLRNARVLKHMNQEAAAKLIGCSQQLISKMENGEVRTQHLATYAQSLGVELDEKWLNNSDDADLDSKIAYTVRRAKKRRFNYEPKPLLSPVDKYFLSLLEELQIPRHLILLITPNFQNLAEEGKDKVISSTIELLDSNEVPITPDTTAKKMLARELRKLEISDKGVATIVNLYESVTIEQVSELLVQLESSKQEA